MSGLMSQETIVLNLIADKMKLVSECSASKLDVEAECGT